MSRSALTRQLLTGLLTGSVLVVGAAALDALQLRLDRVMATAEGPRGWFQPLQASLDAAMRAIAAGDRPRAVEALGRFRHHLWRLVRLERLDAWSAEILAGAAML